MGQETGKFTVSYADLRLPTRQFEKDGIYIGRLNTCEIVLDHRSVSRIHAGINYLDPKYQLINLSSSNVLTPNGRLLENKQSDILADGDIIQIRPFTIRVARSDKKLSLTVEQQFADRIPEKAADEQPAS